MNFYWHFNPSHLSKKLQIRAGNFARGNHSTPSVTISHTDRKALFCTTLNTPIEDSTSLNMAGVIEVMDILVEYDYEDCLTRGISDPMYRKDPL